MTTTPAPQLLAVFDMARNGMSVERICAHAGMNPAELAEALAAVARWRAVALREPVPAVAPLDEISVEERALLAWAAGAGPQRAVTLAARAQVILGELFRLRRAALERAGRKTLART